MTGAEIIADTRKPSPPFGYSRVCAHTLDQQIDIVALFHANKIKANRIAYRVGIDLDLIEKLIAGEAHKKEFKYTLSQHRKNRRSQRLQDSMKIVGIGQAEVQTLIEKEYQESVQQ